MTKSSSEARSFLLTGWGRTAPARSRLVTLAPGDDIVGLLAASRAVIPRGLGRSYGDAAQCAGGLVLDTTALDETGPVGDDGTVTLGAGVSIDHLIRRLLPKGWFPPVTPGTRQVTIGGAFAADVHGKNHHRDGSFASHVESITLATPVGSRVLGPGDDLFWATAGGMGLTGVIVSARLRMLPVETAYMSAVEQRAEDLDAVMQLMDEGDRSHRYSVAWIDGLATGKALGRSVLATGDHALAAELVGRRRRHPLRVPPSRALPAPGAPPGLLNRASVAAFNGAWFRRAPKRPRCRVVPMSSFFHPLDAVRSWNRLYGPRGFLQYQLVVPVGAEDTLRRSLEELSGARVASFLAVLKRFGPGDAGHLSFPLAGWTLALDVPAGIAGLGRLLDRVDEGVAAAGGRVYLAKDSRLRPDLVATMYPRLDEWRRLRSEVDPEGVLVSDLARRLCLCGR